MIYPYRNVLRGEHSRYEPLITIKVATRFGEQNVLALVDSGADQNVLGMDIANDLEVDLDNAHTVTLVGVGEQISEGQLAVVQFELGRHRWVADTIFSDAANQRAILGQEGFFNFFRVDFRYDTLEMNIRRVRQ